MQETRVQRGVARGVQALVLFLVGSLLACSPRASRTEPIDLAETIAARDPVLAERVSSSASHLIASSSGGVTSASWSAANANDKGAALGAHLPKSARDPFVIGLASKEDRADESAIKGDYVLRLSMRNAAESSVLFDRGRAAYAEIAPSTDLVFVAGDQRVEWFYTLKNAHAPTSFGIDVALPAGLKSARNELGGGLTFLDAHGRARVRMPKPFVIDAHGTKREVMLAWDGAGIRIDFDASSLAYPLLLDPAVEHAEWDLVGVASPLTRDDSGFAYDSARGKSVLFGGNRSAGYENDTWEWDGSAWAIIPVLTPPTARWSPAMVYDVARAQTIMFGGINASLINMQDTWSWNGTIWTQLTPANAPSGRSAAANVYDPSRSMTYLFGGVNGTTALNDTWQWDGTNWTELFPTTSPPARGFSAMAFDAPRGQSVLFGGSNASDTSFMSDTWTWDGTNWTQASPATSPSPRSNVAIAYDNVSQTPILFGGAISITVRVNDMWSWNGTTWTSIPLSSPPPGRSAQALAYDVAHARLVMFGGLSTGGQVGDTWTWDESSWTFRVQAVVPVGREYFSMAFDRARGKSVIFGGYSYAAYLNDTWEWDGSVWLQKVTATSPPTRNQTSLAYDVARGKMVLFGGGTPTATYGDTWTYDGVTWAQANPATAPSARSGPTLAYDSARKVSVLYGGLDGGGNYLADTWEWNGATWTARAPATSPPARFLATSVYDSKRGVTVLFGGSVTNGSTTYYADVWEWNGTAWNAPTLGSPKPLGRYAGAMAFDSARGKSILFGGTYTDTSNHKNYFNDTWEWDGTTWTQITVASHPTPRFGAGMAFDSARGDTVLFSGSGNGVLSDTWALHTYGDACTGPSQCDTGSCVDGVCCQSFACGTCESCSLSGTEGTCSIVPEGTQDSDTCTAPNSCGATGLCGLTQGASCANNGDCQSGFCVDAVCCGDPCTGDCQACSTARGLLTNGTCAFASEGTVGRTACGANLACNGKGPDCPTTCTDDASCAAGYYCNTSGACVVQKAQGFACSNVAGVDCIGANCRECAPVGNATEGHCVDNYCCNSACTGDCATCDSPDSQGTCIETSAGTAGGEHGRALCAPYACTGSSDACGATCVTSADCAAAAYCNTSSHTCVGTAPLGAPCSNNAACALDACVGGACCQTSCDVDGGSSICGTGVCLASANYACELPGATIECRPTSCALDANTSAILTLSAGCDSNGGCSASQTIACPNGFGCTTDKTNCNSTCRSDDDCQTGGGYHCETSSGKCLQGATCSADGLSAVSTNGNVSACAPYRCSANMCATTCANINDCQNGFTCDPTKSCVANAAAQTSGGCGCRAAIGSRAGSGVGAWLIALLVMRRRRKPRAIAA